MSDQVGIEGQATEKFVFIENYSTRDQTEMSKV